MDGTRSPQEQLLPSSTCQHVRHRCTKKSLMKCYLIMFSSWVHTISYILQYSSSSQEPKSQLHIPNYLSLSHLYEKMLCRTAWKTCIYWILNLKAYLLNQENKTFIHLLIHFSNHSYKIISSIPKNLNLLLHEFIFC